MRSRPSDTLSQYSYESSQSGDSKDVYVTASDIKRRLTENLQRSGGKRNFKVWSYLLIVLQSCPPNVNKTMYNGCLQAVSTISL